MSSRSRRLLKLGHRASWGKQLPFTLTGANLNVCVKKHEEVGKWETAAPVRTFVAYDSGRSILAGYTCTPVVRFPLADLTPGTKAVGRTVAEFGAVNQPLDMVSFVQDGEEHLLVANSAHGLDRDHVLALQSDDAGRQHLRSLKTASL
ncbi:MAG: hypothetical protein ACRDNF_16070 [Streptosporangiaceae bacterium]